MSEGSSTGSGSIRTTFDYESPLLESFLRALFAAFENAGLPYVVLRNFEALPNRLHKPDLSLLVAPSAESALVRLTAAVCTDHDQILLTRPAPSNILSLRIFSVSATGATQPLLKIDARTYIDLKPAWWMKVLPFLNLKVFLEQLAIRRQTQQSCTFAVPGDRDRAIIELRQWQRKGDLRHLDNFWALLDGGQTAASFRELTADRDVLDRISDPESPYIDTLLAKLIDAHWGCARPVRFVAAGAAAVRYWALRKLRYFPCIIYFSGPDGSGKTTCIDSLRSSFRRYGIKFKYFYTLHKVLRHIGMRGLWLKHLVLQQEPRNQSFKSFLGRGAGHHDRDSGTVAWRLKKRAGLACSFVDAWIGWALAFYWRLRGHHVLVEISPFDLFTKYHMPRFPYMEKLLGPLLPKPALGLLMVAPPASIAARKPELTEQELSEYYERFRAVLRHSRVHTYLDVDTGAGAGETMTEIFKAVGAVLRRK